MTTEKDPSSLPSPPPPVRPPEQAPVERGKQFSRGGEHIHGVRPVDQIPPPPAPPKDREK